VIRKNIATGYHDVVLQLFAYSAFDECIMTFV